MATSKLSAITGGGVLIPTTDQIVSVQGGTTDLLKTLMGSTTFAALPTASANTGKLYIATDVGPNGSIFISNGTTWVPLNGHALLGAGGPQLPVTGTTSETTLATITLPAGVMGLNGQILIDTLWSVTNNANNKTARIYFGGTGGTPVYNPTVSTTNSFQSITRIANRNSASSQVGFASGNNIGLGATGSVPLTYAVNSAVSQTIVFTGQLATSTDTIALESYDVRLISF